MTLRAPAPKQSVYGRYGIGLSRGGQIRVLVESDVGLDDDDVALLDEVAHAPHGIEGGLDHGKCLFLACLELFFLGGMVLGTNRTGTDDNQAGFADRQLD